PRSLTAAVRRIKFIGSSLPNHRHLVTRRPPRRTNTARAHRWTEAGATSVSARSVGRWRFVGLTRAVGRLDPEAHLEPDLEVSNLAVDQMAPNLGHLEPVQVAQSLAGAGDGVADGLIHGVGGGADELGNPVYV